MTEPAETKPSQAILVGPYGSEGRYAWSTRDVMTYSDGSWKAEDSKDAAIAAARKEMERWRAGADVEVEEVEVPRRAPKMGGFEATSGSFDEGGLTVEFGGACPVQGDGRLDGLHVYYRARGAGWSLSVSFSETEDWTFGDTEYAWPDAGYLHGDETEANLRRALAAFRERHNV